MLVANEKLVRTRHYPRVQVVGCLKELAEILTCDSEADVRFFHSEKHRTINGCSTVRQQNLRKDR